MNLNPFSKSKKLKISETRESAPKNGKLIQVIVATLANFSILGPAMSLSFPALTMQILLRDGPQQLTESQVSWFASITAIICPLGGPIVGYLNDKFGRKGTLLIIDFLSIIHWIIIGFSSTSNNQIFYIELMIARVLAGFTIGMITAPAIMYSSEVSIPQIRGRLTVMVPFFVAFGTLLIYMLGFIFEVNTFNRNQRNFNENSKI
jgi:MFS family permease